MFKQISKIKMVLLITALFCVNASLLKSQEQSQQTTTDKLFEALANDNVKKMNQDISHLKPIPLYTFIDKKKQDITLEAYVITDFETLYRMYNSPLVLKIICEAFCDEMRNNVIEKKGDTYQVKPEYAEIITLLEHVRPGSTEFRRKQSMIEDRKERLRLIQEHRVKEVKESYEKEKKEFSGKSFFVFAKNKENKVLGMAHFKTPTSFEKGCVELNALAILPEAQGTGLARPLVFSILHEKFLPETTCIILDTNIWNTHAQAVYKALGFTQLETKLNAVFFRYDVKR